MKKQKCNSHFCSYVIFLSFIKYMYWGYRFLSFMDLTKTRILITKSQFKIKYAKTLCFNAKLSFYMWVYFVSLKYILSDISD